MLALYPPFEDEDENDDDCLSRHTDGAKSGNPFRLVFDVIQRV